MGTSQGGEPSYPPQPTYQSTSPTPLLVARTSTGPGVRLWDRPGPPCSACPEATPGPKDQPPNNNANHPRVGDSRNRGERCVPANGGRHQVVAAGKQSRPAKLKQSQGGSPPYPTPPSSSVPKKPPLPH